MAPSVNSATFGVMDAQPLAMRIVMLVLLANIPITLNVLTLATPNAIQLA